MSKKNSKARKKLEQIYGEGCFMERAGIREVHGYRKDAHQMTYHHMRHKSEGGKATVENGANLALENHQFLHSLPRMEEEKINNQIRQWKMNFVTMKGDGTVEHTGSIDFPDLTNDENCIIIDLQDTIREEEKKELRLSRKKQKFNRAKTKRETQKFIEEELYGEDIEL